MIMSKCSSLQLPCLPKCLFVRCVSKIYSQISMPAPSEPVLFSNQAMTYNQSTTSAMCYPALTYMACSLAIHKKIRYWHHRRISQTLIIINVPSHSVGKRHKGWVFLQAAEVPGVAADGLPAVSEGKPQTGAETASRPGSKATAVKPRSNLSRGGSGAAPKPSPRGSMATPRGMYPLPKPKGAFLSQNTAGYPWNSPPLLLGMRYSAEALYLLMQDEEVCQLASERCAVYRLMNMLKIIIRCD